MLQPKLTRYGPMVFPPNDHYVGRSLSLYGEFSRGEVEVFQHLIGRGWTVLDVGANVGAHTLVLAELVGPEGNVLAFEPQRQIFHMLCANVVMNGHSNVDCIRCGLSNEDRVGTMPRLDYMKSANFGAVSVDMGGDEQVPLKLLDDMQMPIVHFIKIDVEGHEREALLGATDTIHKFWPILYVENDRVEKSPALISLLQSWGYKLYWHAPALFQQDNFNHNDENVFGRTVSLNMLCMPPQTTLEVDPRTMPIVEGPEHWPLGG